MITFPPWFCWSYTFWPSIIDVPRAFFTGCMPGHPQVGLESYSVPLGTFSLRFYRLLIVNGVGEIILDPFEWVRISYQGTQAALLINIFHNLVQGRRNKAIPVEPWPPQ